MAPVVGPGRLRRIHRRRLVAPLARPQHRVPAAPAGWRREGGPDASSKGGHGDAGRPCSTPYVGESGRTPAWRWRRSLPSCRALP